jgi:hypothetical protein
MKNRPPSARLEGGSEAKWLVVVIPRIGLTAICVDIGTTVHGTTLSLDRGGT